MSVNDLNLEFGKFCDVAVELDNIHTTQGIITGRISSCTILIRVKELMATFFASDRLDKLIGVDPADLLICLAYMDYILGFCLTLYLKPQFENFIPVSLIIELNLISNTIRAGLFSEPSRMDNDAYLRFSRIDRVLWIFYKCQSSTSNKKNIPARLHENLKHNVEMIRYSTLINTKLNTDFNKNCRTIRRMTKLLQVADVSDDPSLLDAILNCSVEFASKYSDFFKRHDEFVLRQARDIVIACRSISCFLIEKTESMFIKGLHRYQRLFIICDLLDYDKRGLVQEDRGFALLDMNQVPTFVCPPVSNMEVSDFWKKLVTTVNLDQADESFNCAVCCAEESFRRAAILDSCKHSFCVRCIVGWFNDKNICPLCRKEVRQMTSWCLAEPYLKRVTSTLRGRLTWSAMRKYESFVDKFL